MLPGKMDESGQTNIHTKTHNKHADSLLIRIFDSHVHVKKKTTKGSIIFNNLMMYFLQGTI